MDKEELRVRAEKRRKLAQMADAQDSLVAEIGTAWLQETALKWNPIVQPKVPTGVKVGPDFVRFVKDWMKQNKFRILEVGDTVVKATAEAVASWIDFNGSRVVGIDYPNPLTEINKAKGEGYMAASNVQQTKTAETVYGPIERKSVGLYTEPQEWTRYCPEHPGVMMRRVKDGVYQCPMKGEVFSYTEGHDVEIKIGAQNQTNPNWNDTFPQKKFLDTPNQQSEKQKHPEYKENKDTKYQETEKLYEDDKKEKKAGFKSFTKKAESELGIVDKMFAPTARHSRYCPDHPGVSLYRIADGVFQCPLDREIYDYEKGFKTQDGKEYNGGSIAEMTPDFPEFYQSPHPFLMKGNAEKFVRTSTKKVTESKLRPYAPNAQKWLAPGYPLDKAKEELRKIIQVAFADDPVSIRDNLPGVEQATTTQRLVEHFWYLLMKGEGTGVMFPTKKAQSLNLEYRIARDIERALRGEESAKKFLGLLTDGVFKGKALMVAAKEAYDFMEKASLPQPKTIEVQEGSQVAPMSSSPNSVPPAPIV